MSISIEELRKKHCSAERFIKAKEVAVLLGMDVYTVYRKAKSGQIPCHRFGRSYRFRLSEIDSE